MTSWDLRRPELVVAQLQQGGWLERTQSLICLVEHTVPAQTVHAVTAAWSIPPVSQEARRVQGEAALTAAGWPHMKQIPDGTVRVPVSVRGGPAVVLDPDWAAMECLRLGWIQPYSFPLVITPGGWIYGNHLAGFEPRAFAAA